MSNRLPSDPRAETLTKQPTARPLGTHVTCCNVSLSGQYKAHYNYTREDITFYVVLDVILHCVRHFEIISHKMQT